MSGHKVLLIVKVLYHNRETIIAISMQEPGGSLVFYMSFV